MIQRRVTGEDFYNQEDILESYDRCLQERHWRGAWKESEERLLICLAGIEARAEGKARNAGLRVWSLAEVNTLMKVYGQFRIAV